MLHQIHTVHFDLMYLLQYFLSDVIYLSIVQLLHLIFVLLLQIMEYPYDHFYQQLSSQLLAVLYSQIDIHEHKYGMLSCHQVHSKIYLSLQQTPHFSFLILLKNMYILHLQNVSQILFRFLFHYVHLLSLYFRQRLNQTFSQYFLLSSLQFLYHLQCQLLEFLFSQLVYFLVLSLQSLQVCCKQLLTHLDLQRLKELLLPLPNPHSKESNFRLSCLHIYLQLVSQLLH